jgi:hypothetical protein
MNRNSLTSVIERWRSGTTKPRALLDRCLDDIKSPSVQPEAPIQPTLKLDPDRFKLLKKPLQG